jgi:hypothetical protein
MSSVTAAQPPPAAARRRILSALLWQLPILVVAGAIYAFYLRLPFSSIDSDSATFALMGEDIYRYGHLTTLTYGQNYLFSITPYVYAAFKAVLPKTVPWAFILAAAGGLLAMSGLWMIYASFLSVCEQTRRRTWLSAVLFAVLLLAMPKHFFDFGGNASTELSYFTVGLMLLAASRVAARLRAGQPAAYGWWFVFGLAFGYGLYSRIQTCAYGWIPLIMLLWQQRHARRALLAAAGAFGGGVLLASLPMLLHGLFRAETWPFIMHLDAQWADLKTRQEMWGILVTKVFPAMFSFNFHLDIPDFREEMIMVWVALAVAGYLYFFLKRRAELTPLDHAMFWGPLIVLAIILTHTNMVIDQSNRRYCLQTIEALTWLFCRFCVPVVKPLALDRPPPLRWRALLSAGFCGLLLASSAIAWRDEIVLHLSKNVQAKLARRDLIPELAQHHAVIIANYWDAYVLALLAEGRLKIEAQPWFWVRTYGLYSKAEMSTNTLWLIRKGNGTTTWEMLTRELGAAQMREARTLPVHAECFRMPCELVSVSAPGNAAALMEKFHPRYFSTPYPPGARTDLRQRR